MLKEIHTAAALILAFQWAVFLIFSPFRKMGTCVKTNILEILNVWKREKAILNKRTVEKRL
jgi:hypothetical protein